MKKDQLDIRAENLWFERGSSDRRDAAIVTKELTKAVQREKLAQQVLWEGLVLEEQSGGETLEEMRNTVTALREEAENINVQPIVIRRIWQDVDKALHTTDTLEL